MVCGWMSCREEERWRRKDFNKGFLHPRDTYLSERKRRRRRRRRRRRTGIKRGRGPFLSVLDAQTYH